jgi:predicted N-formylglutamate amidohydrolase
MTHPLIIDGPAEARLLLVADHASNRVPEGINLGCDAALLDQHVAIDIGTEALTRALADTLGATAVLAGVSRLVIDLNREPEAAGLIPATSDGYAITGNQDLDASERARRLVTYHSPYHDAITAMLDRHPVELIAAIHSFTPQLASRPGEARPWQVGLLHNEDSRAAAIAIAHLRGQGLVVGDNEPYSGRQLNYTMNRHAETRGLPYLGFEVRQDLLMTDADVESWRNILAETIAVTLSLLRKA